MSKSTTQLAVVEPAVSKPLLLEKEYANRIRERLGDCVEAIIDVGRILLEAKETLKHGSFEYMVTMDLKFGMRTAQRYMKIAEHPVLSNPTKSSLLPGSWTTLYELSKLSPGRLEPLIGYAITPNTRGKDVENLVRGSVAKPEARSPQGEGLHQSPASSREVE